MPPKQRNQVEFGRLIFHDCSKQSCSNLVYGVLKVEDICSIKMIAIQEGSTELHMHENCILFLPVNILMVWHGGFLGCTTHYCVS